MKEQAYNIDRDKDHKSLTTKAISLISRRSVTMNSLRGRLMPPKRMSTSEAPAMTQAAIKKLVTDNVTVALEAHVGNYAFLT
ncbi:hypothetical protein Tco_0885404 [Tanacetum coccineum]